MKKKFNWIDYSIFALLIIMVIILGLKIKSVITSNKKGNTEIVNNTKEVVIVVEDIREYSVNALNIGDKLYSNETNHYFGEIVDIQVEDSYVNLVKNDGQVVSVRSPEKYNVILTVNCNILERPNGYFAEGITEVKVNSANKYKTIEAFFKGIIYSIGE